MTRADSTSQFGPLGEDKQVEYFFASDASAIIEHTNRVLYLEDDDVAAVKEGVLSIHRLKHSIDDPHAREITTLKMEIQQIMKGNFSSFMRNCFSHGTEFCSEFFDYSLALFFFPSPNVQRRRFSSSRRVW